MISPFTGCVRGLEKRVVCEGLEEVVQPAWCGHWWPRGPSGLEHLQQSLRFVLWGRGRLRGQSFSVSFLGQISHFPLGSFEPSEPPKSGCWGAQTLGFV